MAVAGESSDAAAWCSSAGKSGPHRASASASACRPTRSRRRATTLTASCTPSWVLSMGKFEEPHTGTSSFSMMLGDAPSLDGKYTIFGRVVAGDHVLSQLEQLETRREGIFVKPKERVEVVSAVLMHASDGGGLELHECEEQKTEL
ncbi:hypothetical protein EMIHUDRAFT_452162 [Emiliania huxleyi CCMP1516]|uniref:PPIase cyclophilin-type domain-containing protein n=2 Tax=Emiliania huxleyi TaxID=2903 RepID=A0A0D3IN32_EMIH1|nr:hypothetical protein EMIHUDRAFT_452162 [Emiliania huxleyi CCMP1516]EOD12667.1 hypothetical protein EMIHUDRAFT_452162 [Emiliania huxleyi CCMP1516]|eukprot:XP_005765096.1 hypothetical protein EMIHUDRAFT_452162 [Emiliania huxleyi CCMP1516]